VALPNPDPTPVITATFPFKDSAIICISFSKKSLDHITLELG
jgi:hypothetical protein